MIDTFNRVGFVIQRGLLTHAEVAELSLWLDSISAMKPSESPVDQYFEESLTDGSRILVRIEDFIEVHARITKILLGPGIISLVEPLLGSEAVLFKEKINFKPPGCREDTVHYDQAGGWDRYAKQFLSVSIAIDRNRKENAAMRFLNGGKYRRQLMRSPLRALAADEFSADDEFLLIEAEPGDAIFFDSYVPHSSPANLSDLPRRNVLLTFNRRDAGDHRRKYFEDIRREFS